MRGPDRKPRKRRPPPSAATRALLSATSRGRKHTPEARARISATKLARSKGRQTTKQKSAYKASWADANRDRLRVLINARRALNREARNVYERTRYLERIDERRAYQRSYYAKNRDHILEKRRPSNAASARRIRRALNGWSPGRFASELAKQDGKCAICRGPFASEPHADHDHVTKKARGVLCSGCNTALGLFRDDPKRLRAAIAYLELWA